MTTPTLVVGTARCGSTMLSNMLREHPHILSLSEFFAHVTDGYRTMRPLAPEPVSGAEFWSMVSARLPLFSFMGRQGIDNPEVLYPCGNPDARYSAETGIPAILLTALPHLTDRHEAVFDFLAGKMSAEPVAPVRDQYQRLFGHLAGHFGKRLWIERSGGVLLMADRLAALFPDARFIHMVRDGRDAALSMHRYQPFRLAMLMGSLAKFLDVDPIESTDRTHLDRVPQELLHFLPERFDRERFDEYRFPLTACGEVWIRNLEGMRMLSGLPADRLLILRYEDFFTDPKRQLGTLAAFLGTDYIDEEWSERCAATVRQPKSTWRDLPEEDARALTEACRPGFEALREAGVEYEF